MIMPSYEDLLFHLDSFSVFYQLSFLILSVSHICDITIFSLLHMSSKVYELGASKIVKTRLD
jgi:hypothetical protein